MTMYCTPSTGPHGFHTLGRTVESTLRSFNNLLERLHASYFFYLVPMPHHFIPVGNYLPAAILLGASVTIGGFDCPSPLDGVLWMVPAFLISWIAWIVQMPLISLLAIGLPRPKGEARKSAMALTHLLYGALIPTLAMVNFPQALLLGSVTVLYLMPPRWIRLGLLAFHPWLATLPQLNLRWEWETIGNLAWPGVFAVWTPLWILSSML
jgi:glycosylphosphatidylinositol transamidase